MSSVPLSLRTAFASLPPDSFARLAGGGRGFRADQGVYIPDQGRGIRTRREQAPAVGGERQGTDPGTMRLHDAKVAASGKIPEAD
jgi:hypothetical protein